MKRIFLLIAIIVSLQNLALASEAVIVNSCEKDKVFTERVRVGKTCGPKCMDGWDSLTYYDSSLVSKELEASFKPDMISLPKELDSAAVAIIRHSECDCNKPVSYRIYPEGQAKETNCEEFYKFIQDYNSKCGNCVKTQGAGCC